MEELGQSLAYLITQMETDIKGDTFMDKFKNALPMAEDLTKKIEKINQITPQTLGETVKIYQTLYASTRQLGVSAEQAITLTKRLGVMAGVTGLETQQLLKTVDSLFTGQAKDSEAVRALKNMSGITQQMIRDVRKTMSDAEFGNWLIKMTRGLEDGEKIVRDRLQSNLNVIKTSYDKVMGEVTEGMATSFKDIAHIVATGASDSQTEIVNLIEVIGSFTAVMGTATVASNLLFGTALFSGPAGWAALAVAGIAAAVVALKNSMEEVREESKRILTSEEQRAVAIEKTEYAIKKEVETRKSLSANLERTKKQLESAGVAQSYITKAVDGTNKALDASKERQRKLQLEQDILTGKVTATSAETTTLNNNMGAVVQTIANAVGQADSLEISLRKAGLAFSNAMRNLQVSQGTLNPLQAEYESIQEAQAVASRTYSDVFADSNMDQDKRTKKLQESMTEMVNLATKAEEFKKKALKTSDDLLLKQQEITFESQKRNALQKGNYKNGELGVKQLKDKLALVKKLATQDGIITDDEKLNILKLENQMLEAQGSLIEANTGESKKHTKELTHQQTELEKFNEMVEGRMTGAFDSFFDSLMSGTASWGDAFKMLLADIIKQMMQVYLLENVSSKAGSFFSKLGTSLFGGGITSNLSSLDSLDLFASGGVVTGATAFAHSGGIGIAGEAGAEAIMPITRMTNGDLGVQATDTGVNVIVNNYSNANVETTYDERSRTVELTISKIATEIMRGISPVGEAFESRYGMQKR
jgi:phage-related minor tail protein